MFKNLFKRKHTDLGTVEEQIETLRQQLESHKCRAWKPVTQEGDGSILSSKFSGIPWLAKGEAWPLCQCCGRELTFFLQLSLESLPNELQGKFGEGLLQMFYCPHCDDWKPFSVGHLVRLLQPQNIGNTSTILPATTLPAKKIIAWEAFDDYPTYDEWDDLDIPVQISDRVAEAAQDMLTKEGDKLAGWPYWLQSVEYPSCLKCNKQMQFVFQLDSNDNLGFMFGDAGCGHITQCPEHKDVLAFGWA